MHRKIFDRQLGGTSIFSNKGHNYGWRIPQPTTELYLERLETAPCDQIHLSKYTDGLPIACQFGRGGSSHLCAVTDEEGQVIIFDTRPDPMARGAAMVKHWQAHDNAVFDYSWIKGDSQCLTASGDQIVTLWDIETTTQVTNFRGHNCSVRSVAPCPDNPAQCASGARDGHIMLWDSRVNKKEGFNMPVKSIEYAHSLSSRSEMRSHRRLHRAGGPKGVIDTQQSVTCVLYQTDKLLISSGANDGCVKVWDTRKWYRNSQTKLPMPLHVFDYPGQSQRLKGIVTMCMDPWKSQLFVSYTDNKVYRYEMAGTYQKPDEYVYAGHRNDTFFVRCAVSPDGSYLLSGSGKNTGVIWQVDKPQKRPVFLIGHTEDVSAVDWCPTDPCKLATLSDDMSLRIWRPDPRERGTENPDILGFAYSASAGKQCTRKAQVDIIQDEFPFLLPTPEGSKMLQSSASPATRTSQAAGSEPSMKQVFQAACQMPRRSPRKAHLKNSSVTSSPQTNLQTFVELMTPPSKQRCSGGAAYSADDNSDRENGCPQRHLAPRHLKFQSPQQKRGLEGSEDPHASKSVASPLPSDSHRHIPIVRRDYVNSESDAELDTSTRERLCLRSVDTNSPSKKSEALGLSSPRKYATGSPYKSSAIAGRSPHLYTNSPRRSPRKLCSPDRYGSPQTRRLVFSSPTANLPNSVLDPPQVRHTPPPKEKKVDWLTQYRLSRSESTDASVDGSLEKPSLGTSQKASSSTPGKTSSKGSTPKRNCASGINSNNTTPKSSVIGMDNSRNKRKSCAVEVECEGNTPQKRRKLDGSTTPNSAKRRSTVSRQNSSGSTPRNTSSSTDSPKTPTNMSIRRYFQ